MEFGGSGADVLEWTGLERDDLNEMLTVAGEANKLAPNIAPRR
jgi:hypothetical protein